MPFADAYCVTRSILDTFRDMWPGSGLRSPWMPRNSQGPRNPTRAQSLRARKAARSSKRPRLVKLTPVEELAIDLTIDLATGKSTVDGDPVRVDANCGGELEASRLEGDGMAVERIHAVAGQDMNEVNDETEYDIPGESDEPSDRSERDGDDAGELQADEASTEADPSTETAEATEADQAPETWEAG